VAATGPGMANCPGGNVAGKEPEASHSPVDVSRMLTVPPSVRALPYRQSEAVAEGAGVAAASLHPHDVGVPWVHREDGRAIFTQRPADLLLDPYPGHHGRLHGSRSCTSH
jgi:hypothetical protein